MQFQITKTMIPIVTVLYIDLWTPGYLHRILMNIYNALEVGDVAFYVIMVIGFVYRSSNQQPLTLIL